MFGHYLCGVDHQLCLSFLTTQFIWLGTCQHLAKFDMTALATAFPHFVFSDVHHNLGVILDQEFTSFSLDNLSLSHACYCQLGQMHTVAHSLTATFVHPLITTRVYFCRFLYAGLLAALLSCLDHVLRSAYPDFTISPAICMTSLNE